VENTTAVLITGAAGRIGSVLREAWRGQFPVVRLVDIGDLGEPAANEEVVQLDLADFEAVRRAMKGIQVVVHLAAVASEERFGRLLEANVISTFNVFEAARQRDVGRVIFASTNHVTGFYRRRERVAPSDPVRPDTLYAVTKVFGEALGRLYADKWGLTVVCLRIGSLAERPTSVHELAMWLSQRDAVQLFTRAISAPGTGFLVVYGTSRSRWSSWNNPGATQIGYAPKDDADIAADENLKEEADANGELLQGGPYTEREYWYGP
jgi:uronate dehydrogenase